MTQIKRRSQAQRRADSQRGLLQAAIDLIAAQGVDAVTFESLGRASGFSRGLATQRFGSKQKLVEALLADLHDRQEGVLREHRLDDRPGLEAVLAYVDICLRDLGRRPAARAYFMLLSASVANASDLRAGFRDIHAWVEARLAAWVAKGKAEGAIRADVDGRAAALMIGCLMLGLSMQLMVDPDADVAAARQASLSMVRNSLAADPAP